jgi:hypothetical protein
MKTCKSQNQAQRFWDSSYHIVYATEPHCLSDIRLRSQNWLQILLGNRDFMRRMNSNKV